MGTSEDDVKYVEKIAGKDSRVAQLLRNSRAGEGQTAYELFVTRRVKQPVADDPSPENSKED
jgi:hypothetical protein